MIARFRSPILFIINGLAATGVHYGVLVLLVEGLKVGPVGLANGMASVVGISASYLGNRYVVFGSGAPSSKTLPRFLLLYAAIAAVHAGFLTVWTDLGALRYGIGFIIATAVATGVSYLGNRYFVFPDRVSGQA
jgi:putative flippase GtrA